MVVESAVPQLMLDIGILIIVATLFNILFKFLKQPSFLAYIMAGISLGIGFSNIAGQCLGIIFSGSCIGIPVAEITLGRPDDIAILSELGVAFLLFSVGIESDFTKIREMGKMLLLGTITQVVLSTALVFAILTMLFAMDSVQ